MSAPRRVADLFLIVVLALGALLTASAVGPENRKLLFDLEDRGLFVTALKERGIPYRVDSEGGVWYPAAEVRAVDEISKVIPQRCFPGHSYVNPVDVASFVNRLKAESIPYRMCSQLGREYVTWEPRFSERVKAIVEIVDGEALRRLQEERARSRSRK
jgi:hypothetical protein